jgi:hypothetical protein
MQPTVNTDQFYVYWKAVSVDASCLQFILLTLSLMGICLITFLTHRNIEFVALFGFQLFWDYLWLL